VKAELPPGLVVVVSPHLDDAVLSLGAGIARATRSGTEVRIVTVFAGDPESSGPPTDWDRAGGFTSAGEAARSRREEDRRACTRVGANPVWLPFTDEDHGGEPDPESVRAALAEALVDAEVALLPGYPLALPDHVRVTRWLLAEPPRARLGLYVEQPYAAWRHIGRGRRVWAAPGLTAGRGLRNLLSILLRTPRGRRLQRPALAPDVASAVVAEPAWAALRAELRDRRLKQRAMQAYDSQFTAFGKHTATLIALYELGWGGEGVAWISSAERR
jgi:LmbE family N-acetylglucosaminyl deacetylase